MNKNLVVFFLLFLIINNIFGQSSLNPDIEEKIDHWVQAGYVGDIPNDYEAEQFIDVTSSPYFAIPDDGIDDTSAFIGAINASDENILTLIDIPAGTYNINQSLIFDGDDYLNNHNLFLNGAGSEETILIFDQANDVISHCINLVGAENVGIEDLTISNADIFTSNLWAHNIMIASSADTPSSNCWVIGVESENPINHHIEINNSNHIEVTGNYFHDAQAFGENGQGYGIIIQDVAEYNLVENNIFNNDRHAMLVQDEAQWNVFGYNYSIHSKQQFLSQYPKKVM